MRILVISDVHGNQRAVERALAAQPHAHTVVFLGDGLRQVEDTAENNPKRSFFMVPGNCDFGASLPPVRQESWGGKRFLFTHGHTYDVKYGLYRLDLAARQAEVHVALFGHTHQPYLEYADGLYLLNPGSLGYDGRYAYIDVTPGGIMPVLHHL